MKYFSIHFASPEVVWRECKEKGRAKMEKEDGRTLQPIDRNVAFGIF